MSEHTVTIGDKQFTIASPSLDKTMRITDFVAEILEEVPGIFDEVEQFRIKYRASHREILTAEDFNNPEYAPVIEALGFTTEDLNSPENLVTDENGTTGIAVYQSPGELETIAAVFPKVWKAARANISDLCALLLITDGELEEHDRKGAVNGLIEQRSHWLRYNATLEQLLELISIGLIIVKEQVESASKSLGKVAGNLTEILGTTPESQPAAETSSEPVAAPQ